MDERLKGALQVGFSVLLAAIILFYSDKIAQLAEFGYLGAFIISALASATIFIPAPGWAIVILLGRILNPTLVGIAAGLGSALGEITGYIAGSGAAKIIHDNEHFKKYKQWIKENDLLAIFILAFIPNPLFDIAGLAAGGLGIGWHRFLLATAVGRILRYVLLAQLGAFSIDYV